VVNDTRRLLCFIFCAEEATFARDGINTRNSHWWSEENPHATLKYFNVACLPVCGALSKIFNPNFRTPFYRTKLAGIPAK